MVTMIAATVIITTTVFSKLLLTGTLYRP